MSDGAHARFLKESANKRARIKRLAAKGVSQSEIARLFGITQQRVSQILKHGAARRAA